MRARTRQQRLVGGLLGLTTLLLLCGCSSIKVKLGMRVSLAKLTVTTMEASLPKDPGIAPGEKNPMQVEFTQPDGKVYVTEGAGKGKVLWRDIAVVPTVVTADKKGNLSLPRDPRVSDGKTGHVELTVPSHPGLHASLDLPLRYNYPFVSNYSGSNGSDGSNGTDGQSGTSGSPGSMDPDNPSPGGNGGDGTSGSNGGDGSDGGDGPAVFVRVTLRAGAHPLLQAGVKAAGSKKERFYLVDPQGGTLTIASYGGAGGAGGRGGKGGSGGSGGIGIPPGSSGSSGSDGLSGSSGRAGSGGSITVTYDPSVKPYLTVLRFANPGGPQAVLTQAPVPPLW